MDLSTAHSTSQCDSPAVYPVRLLPGSGGRRDHCRRLKRQLQFLIRENVGELEIVVVRTEYLPAVIAESNDVIQAPRRFRSSASWAWSLEPMLVAFQMSTK